MALASYYKNQQNNQRMSTEALVCLARTSSQGQDLHMRQEAYQNPTTTASYPPSKSHEPKERPQHKYESAKQAGSNNFMTQQASMGSINGFNGAAKKGVILTQNPSSLTSPANYQTQP